MVAPIKEDKRDQLHAVNHEGTGRLQSIDRETNPRYYDGWQSNQRAWLVKQFGQATGVPVVLNTSFNLRGEPIVNTPLEAFNTFRNSDIDIRQLQKTATKTFIGLGLAHRTKATVADSVARRNDEIESEIDQKLAQRYSGLLYAYGRVG